MDPITHKRFLEYRERYGYFGAETKQPILSAEQFIEADAEQRVLEGQGEDGRDEEEEARFVELSKRLFRD